jgi:hypothetical protein
MYFLAIIWVVACTFLAWHLSSTRFEKVLVPTLAGFFSSLIPVFAIIYLIYLVNREKLESKK